MTLHPQEQWIIPEQTVAVARASFPCMERLYAHV
jgi:hypothetical protein